MHGEAPFGAGHAILLRRGERRMPGKKNTNINGIARRWLLTSLGVILVILVVLILVLSMTVRGSIYGNIESILRGRSVELTNVFADYGKRSSSEFNSTARNYVENFPGKGKYGADGAEQQR